MRAVVPHQLAVVGVASERPVQACAPNTARASDAPGLRIKAEGGASPSRLKAWPPLPLWNQCPRTWKFPRLSRKIPGSSVWLAQAGAVPMRLNGASQDGLRSVMLLRLARRTANKSRKHHQFTRWRRRRGGHCTSFGACGSRTSGRTVLRNALAATTVSMTRTRMRGAARTAKTGGGCAYLLGRPAGRSRSGRRKGSGS